ncbi:MAG: glycosyltransferase family 39 protein [Elusimicrobia bacterium]|nr:glycosyltransferase family 39 protein [Elusimicrobiota bacterium]
MRAPAWVWALALLPRLTLFGYVAAQPLRAMVYADSFEYLALAGNLARHHRFATRAGSLDQGIPSLADPAVVDAWLAATAGPPFEANMFRTPGYPLLVAPWHHLSASPLFPAVAMALLQCLAGALTVVLCWHWGARMAGRPGPAAGAAALVALEPAGIVHTPLLLTDTLHVTALAAAALLFWRLLKEDRPAFAALSGLGFSAAIMLRPVALYLPALLGVFLLRRKKCLAAFLCAAYLIPALWALRNQQAGGRLIVSCVGGDQLAHLPGLPAAGPAEGAAASGYVGAAACARQGSLSATARAVLGGIAAEPVLYIKSCGRNLFYLFEGTSLNMLLDILYLGRRPVIAAGMQGPFQFARSNPALAPVWAGGLLLLLALYAAFARGCWRLLRAGRWPEAAFLVGCVAYFAALTMITNGSARYRLPAIPFLAAGASAGFSRRPLSPRADSRARG